MQKSSKASKALIVLLLSLQGCSHTFVYKYYGLEASSYVGTLYGSSGESDIPLQDCAPDSQHKGKCVVMFAEDFFNMKTDYLDIQNRLDNCQRSGD